MPDASSQPETLVAPKAVTKIQSSDALGMIVLDEDNLSSLDLRARSYLDSVINSPIESQDFRDKIDAIHSMASTEIYESAETSNRLMNRPVNAMKEGVFDDGSTIGGALIELRSTVEKLDPSKRRNLLQPNKLLGIIPYGNKLANYFKGYQSAQSHLNAIIETLLNGKDELLMDNAAIEQERLLIWEIMGKLQEFIYIGEKIDESLEKRLLNIEKESKEKARIVREEILFYVRQKTQDLLVNLAVNIQTYLVLDLVRKNNLELIKGIERATTTTIQALRNAVMTAQALNNQKLVLDQISSLSGTTSDIIQATASMLKQQGTEIAKQSIEPTIAIDSLKQSFSDIYESIDMINSFKVDALANMKTTVTELKLEVDRAQEYIEKDRVGKLSQAAGI